MQAKIAMYVYKHPCALTHSICTCTCAYYYTIIHVNVYVALQLMDSYNKLYVLTVICGPSLLQKQLL